MTSFKVRDLFSAFFFKKKEDDNLFRLLNTIGAGQADLDS
mgnify:FL=1|jgi:hypothetical protein